MKKRSICLMLILFQTFSLYSIGLNEETEKSISNSLSEYSLMQAEDEYSLSIMNIQVDAMGLIFFGPQIALDFQFADMIAVGPYMRWHYAGLIYQGVVTDWFVDQTTTSLASYSIGVQARAFIPIRSGQHRPYFGLGFEKSFGSDYWDPEGTLGKRIYEYETNVLHIDVGYRLLTSSSFNLSAGIAIGIARDTKNIGYYENDESDITHYNLETRIMPMVQIILGWQLGK